MTYPEAIAAIQCSRLPLSVVGMHLRHGISESAVCGTCSAHLEYHGSTIYRYCARAGGVVERVPSVTPACGKWRGREAE